jgi:electron transport complex protein RnfA
MELIALAFTAFFIENVLLTQFLGICSFIGVGKKRSSSLGMGLAVIVVIVLAAIVTWTIYNFVMIRYKSNICVPSFSSS